jgi:hypothetical protein
MAVGFGGIGLGLPIEAVGQSIMFFVYAVQPLGKSRDALRLEPVECFSSRCDPPRLGDPWRGIFSQLTFPIYKRLIATDRHHHSIRQTYATPSVHARSRVYSLPSTSKSPPERFDESAMLAGLSVSA